MVDNTNTEFHWLVELTARSGAQPLYLFGGTPEEIASAIIEADDCYGEFGTPERMAKCWTPDAFKANRYNKAGAERTANALDQCCGGIAKAVEHGFFSGEPT